MWEVVHILVVLSYEQISLRLEGSPHTCGLKKLLLKYDCGQLQAKELKSVWVLT